MQPQKVLITGCNRGIGLGLAQVFAAEDWHVFATARPPTSPTLQELARGNAAVSMIPMNVTDPGSIEEAVGIFKSECGQLDILINNAAVFPGEGSERLEELDPGWFLEAFEVNVGGVVLVTRAFLPFLRKSKHPRVVNISSGAGSIAEKTDASYYPYSVSKAALNMLSRTMAADLAEDGIVVVPISPGWVQTEMGGPNATITVEQSATSLFRTICGLSKKESGQFLGPNGPSPAYVW